MARTVTLHLDNDQSLVWDSLVYLHGGGRAGKRKATDELIGRALCDEAVADCVHLVRRRRRGLRLVGAGGHAGRARASGGGQQ